MNTRGSQRSFSRCIFDTKYLRLPCRKFRGNTYSWGDAVCRGSCNGRCSDRRAGAPATATLRNGTHTRTYLPACMCIGNRLRDTLYAFQHLFYVYCTNFNFENVLLNKILDTPHTARVILMDSHLWYYCEQRVGHSSDITRGDTMRRYDTRFVKYSVIDVNKTMCWCQVG